MIVPGVVHRRRLRRPGLIWVGVVAVAQALAAWQELGPPVQPILPLLFVFTVPGFILLDLDHPADRSARILLGIGASLATNVVLVSALLLPQAIWMGPAAAVALFGLWRIGRRRNVVMAGLLQPPTTEPGLELDEEPREPELPPQSYEAPLGVSWKRRNEGEPSTGWQMGRKKRPFEKPLVSPDPADERFDAPAWTAIPSTAPEEAVSDELPPTVDIPSLGRGGDGGLGPLDAALRATSSDRELVDVNSANVTELATLPGLGPRLAQRLVAYHEENGPFEGLGDLQQVAGVGPSKAAGLEQKVRFGDRPRGTTTEEVTT